MRYISPVILSRMWSSVIALALAFPGFAAAQVYAPVQLASSAAFPARRTSDTAGNTYSISGLNLIKTSSTGVSQTIANAAPPGAMYAAVYTFTDIFIDASDNVYAVKSPGEAFFPLFSEVILKFSPSGSLTTYTVAADIAIGPRDPNSCCVAVDRNGNIYTIGMDGAIYLVSASGTQVIIPYSWFRDDASIYLKSPSGLAVDDADNLYANVQVINGFPADGPIEFVVVGQTPVISRQPQSVSGPYATGVTLQIWAASTIPTSFQWLLNGQPIAGAQGLLAPTTDNLQSANFGLIQPGNYSVILSNASGTVTSAVATVVGLLPDGTPVTAVPKITTQPKGAAIVFGTNVSLVAGAGSTDSLIYQWYLNGVPLPGATGATTLKSDGTQPATYVAAISGSYSVTFTGPAGSITSTPAVISTVTASGIPVVAIPKITTQPKSATIVFGANVGLVALAASSDPLIYQWYANGVPIPSATGATIANADGTQTATFTTPLSGSYSVTFTGPAGSITSTAAIVQTVTASGIPVFPVPTLVTAPASTTFAYGDTSTLTASAVSTLSISYQWQKNGVNVPGATALSLTVASPGVYTVIATTSAGSTSSSATISLANRVADIAARAAVGTGDNIEIAGFNIASYSGAPKRVLIRAVGPGLTSLGVGGVLARPVLSLYNAAGQLVASNSGWNNAPAIAAAASAVGDFALQPGSADAALLLDLAPGAYTAQVAGLSATTGVALVEVYEFQPDDGHFIGLATRAAVGTAGNILIGGFVVGGTQSAQLLLRASGPALAQFGVPGVLAQPVLTLYNAAGQIIAINVGWGTSADAVKIATATATVGLVPFQPSNADSAILLTLPPGAYTAQVSGYANSTGNALLEIYQVPNTH